MSIQDVFMYLFGLSSVVSAVGVVLSRKTLNSALFLVATMVLIAAHFAMMRADFLAALQILVYAGAIMILVVFVIMLLGVEKEAERISFGLPGYLGLVFASIFVAVLYVLITTTDPASYVYSASLIQQPSSYADFNGSGISGSELTEGSKIGRHLILDYLFAFQATGVLLLAAIVGAALLAFPGSKKMLPGRGLKAVQEKFNSVE